MATQGDVPESLCSTGTPVAKDKVFLGQYSKQASLSISTLHLLLESVTTTSKAKWDTSYDFAREDKYCTNGLVVQLISFQQ